MTVPGDDVDADLAHISRSPSRPVIIPGRRRARRGTAPADEDRQRTRRDHVNATSTSAATCIALAEGQRARNRRDATARCCERPASQRPARCRSAATFVTTTARPREPLRIEAAGRRFMMSSDPTTPTAATAMTRRAQPWWPARRGLVLQQCNKHEDVAAEIEMIVSERIGVLLIDDQRCDDAGASATTPTSPRPGRSALRDELRRSVRS